MPLITNVCLNALRTQWVYGDPSRLGFILPQTNMGGSKFEVALVRLVNGFRVGVNANKVEGAVEKRFLPLWR